MAKIRKVPERTCLGCHEVKPKKTLIRIVRTPENVVIVDPTGKANGRGAYICPRSECLSAAIKSKRLTRALGVDINPEDLERIKNDVKALIGNFKLK
ncbi:MAG: YlxR family protein [Actinobacteria bacterium]|nr:YlxR family protein [Actinomycetota bacterium]